MKLFNKLFGINTKDLYLGKLGTQHVTRYLDKDILARGFGRLDALVQKARIIENHGYVLVKKSERESQLYPSYKNIFNGEKYEEYLKCSDDGAKVVEPICKVTKKGKRYKYKDAEEDIKKLNKMY